MKKRSAMTIAAGLVAALLTGAVALSMGLTGADKADAGGTGGGREPRIRTVHRTVTVHREAKAEEPRTVTIVTAGASSPASSDPIGNEGFDDEEEGFQDDVEGEDEFEDEDEDEHVEEPEEEHEDEEHDD